MTSRDTLENTMRVVDAFTKERDWEQFHSVKNLMASVSIEASELNETVQWSNPTQEEVQGNSQLLAEIGDELADVMVYCLRLCSILGIEPIEMMNSKIEKNRLKYPIEKAKGNSAKYTAYEK
ncbi:MAG: nucleotide pyrophosphohydrolase [Candidatus Poseidoniales archaeon]